MRNQLKKRSKKHTTSAKSLISSLALAIGSFFLTACGNTPTKVSEQGTTNPEPKPKQEYVTTKNFSSNTLYSLIVAEMAIDRKKYDIALDNYTEQAKLTRDINVVSRATQISQILKSQNETRELVSLWMELEPDNLQTEQILVNELIKANELDEAFSRSVKLLENNINAPFDSIAAKTSLGTQDAIQQRLSSYETLIEQGNRTDTLLLGQSFLLDKLERYPEALASARQALKLNPNQLQISIHEIRVLEKMNDLEQALVKQGELVEQYPDNIPLRARYARKLVDSNLEESKNQFAILSEKAPQNAEVQLSLAIVTQQLGQLDEAAEYYQTLLAQGQLTSTANLHIAQIREVQKQYSQAIEYYLKVGEGRDYIKATVSAAKLINDHTEGGSSKAIELISTRRQSSSPSYYVGLTLIHAELLANSGHNSAAEQVLSEGINKAPEDIKLLYARAMIYSKINAIDAAEKDLRKIIAGNPNNSMALNALGYTLADKTDRKEEAFELISKAFELSPQDPAILDSLGWVEFHRGNLEIAETKLRQAMELMPDHEIAAHLGEVLWMTGKHEEAIKIWKEGLKLRPESEVIHKTLHRLNVELD